MSIRLPVRYACIHAKATKHSEKLDRPSQRTLIFFRPLRGASIIAFPSTER
jgi:hypothetical protein